MTVCRGPKGELISKIAASVSVFYCTSDEFSISVNLLLPFVVSVSQTTSKSKRPAKAAQSRKPEQ